jgi:hypothetical protein
MLMPSFIVKQPSIFTMGSRLFHLLYSRLNFTLSRQAYRIPIVDAMYLYAIEHNFEFIIAAQIVRNECLVNGKRIFHS